MEEEIYGDVLFIINFSMDFLALYLTGRLLHRKLSAWRVIFGATIGALYGVIGLVLSLGVFGEALISLSVMLIMCLVAFETCGGKRFFLSVLLFGGVSMLIGGVMTASFVHLGPYRTYIDLGGSIQTVYGDIPMWLFVILAALSALFTWLVGRLFRRERGVRRCLVRLAFDGEEVDLSGLCDSANLVTEPFSDTPVMFLKENASSFLPQDLLLALKNGVDALEGDAAKRIRLIPMKTVSGEGIITAAVPRRCYMMINGEWEAKKALVAIDFTEGDFGGCPLLVPESLLL